MDDLIAKREKVCLEVLRDKQRVEMRALLKEYNIKLKAAIVKFYDTYADEIQRILKVCAELKTCTDVHRLETLKREYVKFSALCDKFPFKRLTLYQKEHGYGYLIFPQWDVEVVQEWLIHWNVAIILGGTSAMDKFRAREKTHCDTYHELRSRNDLPVATDQDYKGEHVWIDFPGIILKCHRWRELYQLESLDAIILHVK